MKSLHLWGSSTFGNVKRKVKALKDSIQEKELDEWLEREELWWRQRSRAEWLKEGDRNTAFFHQKASQRRRRNHLDRIKNQEGDFCETQSEISAVITNYFHNIFLSQVNINGERWSQEFDFIPKLVTPEMNEMLAAPFSEGEVKRALFQMHPTKAPGLDGFPATFYQTNWDIVGRDVAKEVLSCLNGGELRPELNETLIMLVPKVKNVDRVEDLRPISLCNVVMKITTKVLANRLKEVLPEIISQSQGAFLGGRLITDNILIAHEISHYMKCQNKQRHGFLSLKLDMSKAYDRIEWSFLERMMRALGFSEAWVKKIMVCVETVTYKVKINDQISEVVNPSRGLRQGDPISPYLFLICADWLTYAVSKYQELGLLQGIKVSRGASMITHLMFADDCMLFVKAEQSSVSWVRDILKRYEAVSGQKINFAKSEGVCSTNVPDSFKQYARDSLQIRIVDSHSQYLGLPLLFGGKKVSLFRSLEEKTLRRISDWKHKLLSGAGREVLSNQFCRPSRSMLCRVSRSPPQFARSWPITF
ncbi:hypothetical protein QQ045_027857 [Rhodiola kirilowii]